MTQLGTPPGDLGNQAYEGLKGPLCSPHAHGIQATKLTTTGAGYGESFKLHSAKASAHPRPIAIPALNAAGPSVQPTANEAQGSEINSFPSIQGYVKVGYMRRELVVYV
jgi:hypothetical protein